MSKSDFWITLHTGFSVTMHWFWVLQKRKVLKSNLHFICKILISPGNSSAIRAPVGANKNVGNRYVPLCVKLEEEENNKSSWQSYINMILEIEVSRGLVDHLVLKTEMSLGIEIMKLLMAIPLLIKICWVLKMTIKISLLTKGVRYGVCCFAPLRMFWMTTHGATPARNAMQWI